MYGCESWTIKKAEHRRTDSFKLLKKTLESPLDSKEIKPVNPKGNIELEGLMLKPKLLWSPDSNSRLIGKDPGWERLRARGEGDNKE